MKITKFLLVLLTCMSSLAWAKNECKPNNVDVCKAARAFADEMAQSLPMKMSQNITLEKAFAIKGMLSLTAMLGYKGEYLEEQASKAGVSMDNLAERMRIATVGTICEAKSSTAAFIKLGGQIEYIYRFSDGLPYLTIDIDTCNG